MILTELLFEMPMKSHQEVTEEGLALYILREGGFVLFILYDPAKFTQVFETEDYDVQVFETEDYDVTAIKGFIKIRDDMYECGAWMVAKSIAQKNYGPLMYDIAMNYTRKPLMSDRSSVSKDAQRVWSRMLDDWEKYKKVILTQDEEENCSSILRGHQYGVALKRFSTDWVKYKTTHNKVMNDLVRGQPSYDQQRSINRAEEMLIELTDEYWKSVMGGDV